MAGLMWCRRWRRPLSDVPGVFTRVAGCCGFGKLARGFRGETGRSSAYSGRTSRVRLGMTFHRGLWWLVSHMRT